MEVAGLVVGVLPLVMTAMQCYQDTRIFLGNWRKKDGLFKRLLREVKGYDAILNENLDWVLLSTGVCESPGELDREALLKRPEVADKIKELLGERSAEAFQNAICEIEEALEPLVKTIERFLMKQPKAGNSTLTRITFNSKEEVKLRCRDGFKLALSSKEIEQCIAKVDHAHRMMESLLNAKTKVLSLGASHHAKIRIKEIVQSLTRIRNFASHLYQAIAACWTQGCQSIHEINLRLEDRIIAEPKSRKLINKADDSVRFDAVFVSKGSPHQSLIWRASLIEVLCKDNSSATQEDVSALEGQQSGSRVRFVLPQRDSRTQQLQSCKITDICLEVCKAQNVRDILHLYVHPTRTVHHQTHTLSTKQDATASAAAVTLQELLSSASGQSHRLRLSPRACTELALILASALLQLSETPWCAAFWTKEGLSFTKGPARFAPSPHSSNVDITRPLVVKAFQPGVNTSDRQQASKPKKVLLEFAILMLELWHGISIEERFSDRPSQVQGDDLDRKHLAERWLKEDDLLGFQYDAIGTCLEYYNVYKVDGDITWEDEEFLQGFVAGVLEPLHRESNKSRAQRPP